VGGAELFTGSNLLAMAWASRRISTGAHTLGDFLRRGLLDTAHHRVVIRDAELLAEVPEGEEPQERSPPLVGARPDQG
jgi:hypothetical protein